ncbi:hypothetical protein [Barnesiella viscericola]|uniref:Uncharacterized protein n=1 Tax=Barnesiella viscericola TaxID=397865 RepID=A0A921SUK5_9BACT|nr:hypothetical protein [Barnesiella viscericola]HJG89060.1 hypothetical protein [Barnesiella viscericola]
MEKKKNNWKKIWTAVGMALAIVLLLYWLTLAIWIDDSPEAAIVPETEEASNY